MLGFVVLIPTYLYTIRAPDGGANGVLRWLYIVWIVVARRANGIYYTIYIVAAEPHSHA
jgi:hypothetical protein